MLILSRLEDESIVIVLPDNRLVTVQVTRIKSDRCRLGIDAPDDIPVHRREIYDDQKSKGAVTSLAGARP